ncbi:uncharacterized protein [Aristolochia californica]|uniref:uncharacterized protein n=1 Tax=Aristolochia californica TaxID=171875 RepID=UPI0035E0A0A0
MYQERIALLIIRKKANLRLRLVMRNLVLGDGGGCERGVDMSAKERGRGRRMEHETVGWGTWEELLLGGAVLRHGTLAWEAVASEVQSRTLHPNRFTPKECKARYEDLQERFCGCSAWFEELRKQRVAELKRELEESEDSIGSLKSRLRRLMSARQDFGSNDIDTSLNLRATLNTNAGTVESTDKVKSQGRSSAGSFTEESTQFWSSREEEEVEEVGKGDIKVDGENTETEAQKSEKIGQTCVRKRRGKRKRKACTSVREASAGDSDVLSSAAADRCKVNGEESARDYDRSAKASVDGCSSENNPETNLEALLDSVMEDQKVSIFRRRSESQRRARYKKCIRRHVDFGTLRSGIREGSISSTIGLYRDLLLLSSNAIAFYPKNSLEYQSALALRGSPALKRLYSVSTSSASGDLVPSTKSYSGGNPVKKRSQRVYNNRITKTMGKTQNTMPTTTQTAVGFSEYSPPVDHSPRPQPTPKRVGRPSGGGRALEKRDALSKGRKKQRTR